MPSFPCPRPVLASPGAPAPATAPSRLLFLGRVPGQAQENVVERRPPQREPAGYHLGGIQAADHLDQRVRAAAADPDADHAAAGVGDRLALADLGDRGYRVLDPVPFRHGELDDVAADPALQLLGRARRDDQAVVDDHDLVRELVGLVQVLRGQQQRGPVGRQRPDDVPHPQPRPRVQAGGGLVEEQHLRPADQAGGQVQAPLHAAGVSLGRPVGRVAQAELLEQLGGPAPGLGPAQVIQPPDDLQVLLAGELLLDGGRLAGQPDRPADRGRVAHHVIALDQRPPSVGKQQRGQDPHRRGLPRPVRTEHAEHRPAGHGKIDTAQRVHLAERFRQALDEDRGTPADAVDL